MNNKRVTIYRLLYILINILYTIVENIQNVMQAVYERCIYFYHEIVLLNKNNDNNIINELNNLNKTPKHVTVFLSEELPNYEDLANIVLWSLITGITFISFYDFKDMLHSNQDKFEEALNKKLPPNAHVIWHNSGVSNRNGFIGPKIHIKFLTNGRKAIVNATKLLCKTGGDIGTVIQGEFEFPEPDLAISFGKYLRLHSYNPWQLRLTEFVCIKSHYNISFKQFRRALVSYSKCEQRLGI